MIDSITNPDAHDFEHHAAQAPTCTEVGWDAYDTCSRCDYTTYVEKAALGHTYGDLIAKVEASCTSTGVEAHYFCDVCDTYFTPEKIATTKDALSIAAEHELEHHAAQAPTCTEIGWDAYDTCSRCDYTTYVEKAALGHAEGGWEITVPPTIESDGERVKKCTRCQTVLATEVLPQKTAVQLVVSVNDATFGSATAGQTLFDPDTPGDATVTATPADGYNFMGWFNGDVLVSREASYTFAMPSSDYALTARFSAAYALNVWDGTVATEFAGGSGTESDPYQIATGAQLALMRDRINTSSNNYYNKYYVLIADIDLAGLDWQPIGVYYYSGSSASNSARFYGVFDGQGHVIRNFNVVAGSSYERYFGLFGYVYNGTVKNLGVEGYTLSILGRSTYVYGGGLVGVNDGTISNCYATGDVTVSSSGYYAHGGGLVGYNDIGTISNCYATGDVTVSSSSHTAMGGGLVGLNNSGTISNCYATGDVTVSSSNSIHGGGLVGSNNSGTISNCYATGDVTVSSIGYGGGLVGSNNSGTISNCYATGDVTVSGYYVYGGGLVGCNYGTISNCYRYEGQVITAGNQNIAGTACTADQLNDPTFYTQMLGWDETVWFLDGLDFASGYSPVLCGSIHIGGTYYQLFVTPGTGGQVNYTEYVLAEGSKLTLVATPDIGYSFVGWYHGDTLVSSSATYMYEPTESLTLRARFEMIDYTLTVDGVGVTVSDHAATYHYGDEVTLTATVQEGYTFIGWYHGDELITSELTLSFTMPAEDYALTAKTKGNTYTVTYAEKAPGKLIFNSMGGSSIEPATGNITEYPIPTLEGYVFAGWYNDIGLTSRFEFTGMLTEEKIVYAAWIRHTGDGVIAMGQTLEELSVPSKGSSSSYKYYAFVPLVSGTVTIYSSSNSTDSYGFLYDANKQQLASDDDSAGSNNNFKITYTVTAGELYYIAPAGYNSSCVLDLTLEGAVPSADLTIENMTETEVEFGSYYTLNYAERSGYDFVGYFTEANGGGVQLTDGNGNSLTAYNILDSRTVYAYYTPCRYTVSFDYNGGQAGISEQEAVYLEDFTLPAAAKDRYTFVGWSYNGEIISDGAWTITDGDITLTAIWEPIAIQSITFETTAFEYVDGSLELVYAISPADAYYKELTLEIIYQDADMAATLEGNIFRVKQFGEAIIQITAYGLDDEIIYTNQQTIYAYSTDVVSVEIANENNVILVGERIEITHNIYPTTAFAKGDFVYQLASNTCGAEINGNTLTVKQAGSVRVRVKVDDSEYSPWYTFHVPQTITTAEEFNNIRNDLSGYYILGADIDLSSYTAWQPIGYAEDGENGLTYDHAFKGYLDGNGYKITGLTIDIGKVDQITAGLFGALDNVALIKDLVIEDYYICGENSSTLRYIGGLSGIVGGIVRGGSVSGFADFLGGQYVGGVAGYVYGEISGMEVDVELGIGSTREIDYHAGGVVGYYSNGKLEDISLTAAINLFNSNQFYVGGVAGRADGLISSVNISNIDIIANAIGESGNSYAGLYVGKTDYTVLKDVEVIGSMELNSLGNLYVGSIAGSAVSIEGGHYVSSIKVSAVHDLYYGSAVGYASGTISSLTAIMDEDILINAEGNVFFGGIAGYVANDIRDAEVQLSNVQVSAKGNVYFGGIAGKAGASAENVTVTANAYQVQSDGSAYVGGAFGYGKDAINIADVEINTITVQCNDGYVGGVAGQCDFAVTNATLVGKSMTIKATTGSAYIGGIVGYSAKGAEFCQASVDIHTSSQTSYIGGIAGKAEDDIAFSQYAGEMEIVANGELYLGGIVGDGVGVSESKVFTVIEVEQTKPLALYVGGIAGRTSGIVEEVTTFGYLDIECAGGDSNSTVQNYIGGIVGKASDVIRSSRANMVTDIVSSGKREVYAGGVAGYTTASITETRSDGQLTIETAYTTYAGGIAGYSNSISNSYAIGDVTVHVNAVADLYAGGIAGYQAGVVSECYYSYGDLGAYSQGRAYVGGISGYAKANIEDSYSSYSYIVTDMSTYGTTSYLGGIAGYNGATIQYTYAMTFLKGTANGADRTLYIGGLVGYNAGNISSSYVKSAKENCIWEDMPDDSDSNADIETTADLATIYSGGFVGYNGAGNTIQNCYTDQTVVLTRAGSYTGGFVGVNVGTISNCISRSIIMTVFGEKVGAFAGQANEQGSYTNCFFATDGHLNTNILTIGGLETYEGITGKSRAELKGTSIYADYDKTYWSVINGKFPTLIFSEDKWEKNDNYGCGQLIRVSNSEDQHQYPIPDSYCKITFDVNGGEYPVAPIYVHEGEEFFLVNTAQRIGYVFDGWYFETGEKAEGVLTLTAPVTLYAHWTAIPYTLTLVTDGAGTPVANTEVYIYKDEITLSTTESSLDYIFVGWYNGDVLLSDALTYTFTAPPEDLVITAKYLSYYDLIIDSNSADFGTVAVSPDTSDRGIETHSYTVTAAPADGYNFMGWFNGDVLVSREASYTFAMPSSDYALTARFSKQLNMGGLYPIHREDTGNGDADIWDGTVATEFAGGSGTESDPYQIATGAQLALMRDRINTRNNSYYDDYYVLIADIDLAGLDWQPIGVYYYSSSSYSSTLRFSGVFDGQGHVIRNFNVVADSSYEKYFGLFGYVSNGTVKNLGVEGYTLSILDRSNNVFGGGLVGSNSGTISNCYATGDVTVSSSSYSADGGGLVGYNSGSISNCYATGNVTVSSSSSSYSAYGGGLVGENYGTISNCYATGDVTVSSSNYHAYGGGLVGYNSSGTISNCYATGDVTVSSSNYHAYGGGLVGENYGTISNCYATGDVTVRSSSSYSADGGGLVGYNGETISNCYATGDVTVSSSGSSYGGGLVGYNNSSGTISNCYATGDVTVSSSGSSYGGGLVGYYGGTISNCYRYEGQVITAGTKRTSGTACTADQLNDPTFYTQTLGWDETVWFLGGLDFASGYSPVLCASIHIGGTYYQLFVTPGTGGQVNYTEYVLAEGSKLTLVATPDIGYSFVGWYHGDTLVSSSATYMYESTESLTLRAVFKLEDYTLTVDDHGVQAATGAGTYHYGDSVTLRAPETEGYIFLGWYDADGDLLTEAATYAYTVPAASVTLEARYRKYYQLTADVADGQGSTDGTAVAYETETRTVSTVAAEGYQFIGWFDGDVLISTNEAYTFEMPAKDYTLTARYTKQENLGAQTSYDADIWDGSVATEFAGGSGTASDPYQIATGAQLALMRDRINTSSNNYYNKYYVLIADIDLAGLDWQPIGVYYYSGSSASSSARFYGVFDGQGHVIRNFNVVAGSSYEKYFGLFGYVYNGTVKNLGVTDFTLHISDRAYDIYGGGVAGYSTGTISNCYAIGNVSISSGSGYAYGGGLVGSNSGAISNCYAAVDVSVQNTASTAYSGGLVGYLGGTIKNSYATGDVWISTTNSSSAYVGGLVGYKNGTINNSYRYEGQVVTADKGIGTPNEEGISCTAEQLNDAQFFTQTLGWTEDIWFLNALEYASDRYPVLTASLDVGETYYQLFITSSANGTVNISEYIVKRGTTIYLVGAPEEGYEVAVWRSGDLILGGGNVLAITPTESMNIYAEFDFIRYTVLVDGEEGLTIPAYDRYYQDEQVTLTAEVADGYVFDGWFLNGELVCEELTYSFTMPAEDRKLEARSTIIDYQLTVTPNNISAGMLNTTGGTIHVNDPIELTYRLNEGYRFLGWYQDGNLVSENLQYSFSAPAGNLSLEARTEAIDYTFTYTATDGGTVQGTSGTYHVGDQIQLTATPNETYEFIGWYHGDRVVSYDANYTYTMPAENVQLLARFEVGVVTMNVVAGLNGSVSIMGDSEFIVGESTTLIAQPNDGYVFDGWYCNDVLISKEATYSTVYHTSGHYSYLAKFEKAELSITYYPQNGAEPWTEIIADIDGYVMPYAYREGYAFEGWYTSPAGGEQFNLAAETDTYAKYIVYAQWTQRLSYTQIYSVDDVDYSVTVYSRSDLTNATDEYIICNTLDGEPIVLTVQKSTDLGAGYYILSGPFVAGENYSFDLASDDVYFVDQQGQRTFVVSFARLEVAEYSYQSNLREIAAADIISQTSNGMVLRSLTPISATDIIYCSEEGFEILKCVESVELTGENEYTILFAEREIELGEVFQSINVNAPQLDLGDAVEIGDSEEALMAFAEMGMELASVNALYGQLNTLAAETNLFSFDEPKATPRLTYANGVITGSLEITVDGKRYSPSGEELDKIRIRVYLELRNELDISSDIAMDIDLTGVYLNRFNFEAVNTTTITINVDAVYADKDTNIDYEALKTILSDYEQILNEKKDMPFDTESKHEYPFEKYKIEFKVPLIENVLYARVQVTPFLRYQVIGQIDINTEFSMTNSVNLIYANGQFNAYYNSSTDKNISVYALAYLNVEAGIALNLQIQTIVLPDKLNIGANFELGRYVTASGVLVYENGNGNLAGFVEYGKFYDWDIYYTLFTKKGSYDPDKVSEPIGTVGSYYLYLAFDDAEDEYVLEEYAVEIYEVMDHDAVVFNLKDFGYETGTMDSDEYRYYMEENDYLYVDNAGILRVKHIPTRPVTVKLTIKAGFNTEKVVTISFNVQSHDVSCSADQGTISADAASAMKGQLVTFVYNAPSDNIVVDYWEINGEKINSKSSYYSCFMGDEDLDVRVVTTVLSDVIYINSVQDFLNIKNGLDKTYVQMADLDFSGVNYQAIGDFDQPFTGKYFGNGYEIRNISYGRKVYYSGDNTGYLFCSLFGYAENAEFHGLTIRNAKAIFNGAPAFQSQTYSIYYGGAVLGRGRKVVFQDCQVIDFELSLGAVLNKSWAIQFIGRHITIQAGGLAGLTDGVIAENCVVVGTTICTHVDTIDGWSFLLDVFRGMERNIVGGLFGENYHAVRVRNCYVQVDFDVTRKGDGDSKSFIGGVAGLLTNSKDYDFEIENCIFDITSTHAHSERDLVNAVASFKNSDPAVQISQVCNRIAYVKNDNISVQDGDPSTGMVWGSLPDAVDEDLIYRPEMLEYYGFSPVVWEFVDSGLRLID